MTKKKQVLIKMIILAILYFLLLPVTLIVFKLIPYIIANDTNIDLKNFSINILKHPINSLVEIKQAHYMIPFLIVQIIVLIALYIFLNPVKRQPFEVVGKTNPVHGSAYWGEENEINAPQSVHLISEKSMKSILEQSIRSAENE